MENKRFEPTTSKSNQFINLVKKSKLGDKQSMEKILFLFKDEIEYLSQFILLPREESYQALQTELINIVLDKL